jgi:putative flippase GtrA
MKQFASYFVVGGAAFVLHVAVLEGLLAYGFQPAWLASAIGFVVACLANFTLQRLVVFRSRRSLHSAAWRYAAVTLAMLGVNTILFSFLNSLLGVPPLAAQTVTTGSVFVLNFVCNRHFTFAAARA